MHDTNEVPLDGLVTALERMESLAREALGTN
jgi:hypothetical protein